MSLVKRNRVEPDTVLQRLSFDKFSTSPSTRRKTAMRTLENLVQAFIERTLPKAEWTHEAHLRVGLWHVFHLGEPAAMDLLRERIQTYNESVGGKNTESEGYHETITRFYVITIADFLKEADRTRPLEVLAEELTYVCGDRNLPLRSYSKERLFSKEARLGYVEPDLKCRAGECG